MLEKIGAESKVWDKEMRRANQNIRLFRDFFRETPFWSNRPLFPHISFEKELALINYAEPLIDIYEKENEVIARIEIPGMNREDIKINSAENGIEVKAERKNDAEGEKEEGRYRIERSYSGFYRFFTVPASADTDKIDAHYKDGILELRIPKISKEAKKTKEIEIK